MRKKIVFWSLIGVGVIYFLQACGPFQERELVGHWAGAIVLENGDTLGIDPSIIRFHFSKKGAYTFQSTLNYKESGAYFLDGHLLYTTDTLNKASSQKAVQILLLTPDSLHLRMLEDGKERLLKLKKEK
ncbi:MAG: hypothetical protein IPH16_11685 [Haliscomenobacter sp.]|nr:hypothetical protein [Haliscomenobacter sp.]MBK7474640.1 hypothetical protein [Haliscomenobacter sp.]